MIIDFGDECKAKLLVSPEGLFGVRFPDSTYEIWQEQGESEGWFLHRVQQLWQGLQWVGETDGKTIPGGQL